MLFAIPFPAIDPVAVEIGPFAIRWYALAYIAGLLLGWRLLRRLMTAPPLVGTLQQADDFLTWATLGVILGGRLGYVLFYRPEFYLTHPVEILKVWTGGMSFHGGALGVIVAIAAFARANRIPFLALGDRVVPCVPIGLGLGRLANFVNGELWGRVTDVPWGMIFPHGGPLPRHPSQLYQATLEGLVLFLVLIVLAMRPAIRARQGFLGGAFLAGYGIARIIGEFFREPDSFLGFLAFGATMGQLLSVPMVIAGAFLMVRARPAAARG